MKHNEAAIVFAALATWEYNSEATFQNMRRAWAFLKASRVTEISILVLACLIAASGWFDPGLLKGHDAFGTIINAEQIRTFLSNEGYFDCPSHSTLGGFQLDTPQFYYFLAALSFFFSWSAAAKIFFFLIYALSAVFAYLYTFELTRSRPASFVTGLAYVFAPYYLIEVVFEGHWSIGAQYMLTPLVFLATEKAIQQPRLARTVIAGLSLALLIGLGHPQTLPILVGPFLGLYMLFRVWQSRREGALARVAACLVIVLIGLSLTASWWLPLLREISSLQAPYTIEASEAYQGTLLQVLTLRPTLCCATASTYEASASGITSVLRFLPFALAVLGVILNYRNKYVWFFSATILITGLLAMGSSAPVDLFGFAHRHMPLFSSLRTPVRFLLFTSFSYAILTGFCIKGTVDWLGRANLRELKRCAVLSLILISACLVLMANTWHDAKAAFSDFTLSPDQKGAQTYLAAQKDGDFRIADACFDIYAQNPDSRYIVNPTNWTFAHGKETLPGGMPPTNAYTTNLMESLQTDLTRGRLDMTEWFSLLNLKYILIDSTDPLSSNIVLDAGFERVWASDTIDIYENHAVKPRVFSITATDESPISLYAGDTTNLRYAEGTREAVLTLGNQHTLSSDLSLMSTYSFSSPSDYACFEADVRSTAFHENDAIHLVYYSDDDIPDVHLSLELIESDGSRYDVVLGAVDGIKAGWNEVNFPISLLTLRYSDDENAKLDLDQISKLWIGVGRQGASYKSQEFNLYFDSLSIVTQETNTNVEYTKVRPGKYRVHVSSDSPTCLVLSESYHPNWVARVNGKTVHSQVVYQALNGFYLEAGEYDITLEFAISPLRIAGNVITGVAVCILCLLGVYLLAKRWQDKRRSKSTPTTT
jgi:hypothetical protein